jgi:hypothetical protein
MFVRAVSALLALSGPAAALAEIRSEVLMDLLSQVPTEAIESELGDWSQLWFADVAEAAGALDPAPAGADLERLAKHGPYARVVAPDDLGMAMGFGLEGAWEPLIGFGPREVEAALGFKAPQLFDGALVIRLGSAATGRVGPALLANGYVEETRDGVTAWARGAHSQQCQPVRRRPRPVLAGRARRSAASRDRRLAAARGPPEP